jgi:hypothetical protein
MSELQISITLSLFPQFAVHSLNLTVHGSRYDFSLSELSLCSLESHPNREPVYVLENSANLFRRGKDTDLQKMHQVMAIQPVHWRSG